MLLGTELSASGTLPYAELHPKLLATFLTFAILGRNTGALCIWDKCPTAELHPQSLISLHKVLGFFVVGGLFVF